MVVVVPALPEDEHGDEPVVSRLVAVTVVLVAEHMADRIHAEGRVLVEEDPQQAAPDEPLEPRLPAAADGIADSEGDPEGEDHPEQVGPVDPADEAVVVEVLPVVAP